MTTTEMFEQMKTELDDRVAQLRSAMNEMQASCYHAAHTLCKEVERMTKPAPAGDEKLYTALDVIQMVQAAVSDAVCGMSREESTVTAYEIEREIIAKLVQEGANERKSRESEMRRSHTGRKAELRITTASNNSSDVPQTAPD